MSALKRFHGFWMNVAWMAAFTLYMFAFLVVPVALNTSSPITVTGLLTILALIGLTLLLSTVAMHEAALDAKSKAQKKVELQRLAAGSDAPIILSDQTAANAVIPSYWALLRRNLAVCVLYVPLMAVVGVLLSQALFPGWDTVTNSPKPSLFKQSPLLLAVVPAAAMATATWSWKLFGSLIDKLLLKRPLALPESEEVRREKATLPPPSAPTRRRIAVHAARVAGMLVAIVFVMMPILLMAALSAYFKLSRAAFSVLFLVLSVVWLVLPGLFWTRVLQPRLNRRLAVAVEEVAENPETPPEEAYKLQQAVLELRPPEGVRREAPLEVRVGRWAMFYMFGVLALGFGAAIFVAGHLRANGSDPKSIENMFALILFLSFIAMLVGMHPFLKLFGPKSKMQKHMATFEEQLYRGNYQEIITLMERLMQELPNYETRVPAAVAYAQAGQFDEAERLTHLALQEFLSRPKKDQDSHKPQIGIILGLLGEIKMYRNDLGTSEDYLNRAAQFESSNYAFNNSCACLALLRGNADKALDHLNAAEKSYQRERKPVTGYNKALRAWAFALKGQYAEADTLLTDALSTPPPERRIALAEIYLIRGYILRAERKPIEALSGFRKALELDPDGAIGIVARRELETSTNV